MSRGTVKDPTGHQSPDHAFGYLQRTKGNPDIHWKDVTDNGRFKVIPYLNKIDLGNPDQKHSEPDEAVVRFQSVKAYVCYEEDGVYKKIGDIGIAVLNTQEELLAKWPEAQVAANEEEKIAKG